MQIPLGNKVRVNDGYGSYLRKQPTLERPAQLGLPFYGKLVDVDGMTDPKYGEQIRYMGKANHVFDDVYWCLAIVGGALCAVEVTIRPHDHLPPSPEARV